jgi:Domain of unknown function (DUF4062)
MFIRPFFARILNAFGLQPSLRVFLSSTSEFVGERAMLERELRWLIAFTLYERIPASGTKSLDEEIRDWIADSDVALGIYGTRRGHVPLGHALSVTEAEYGLAHRPPERIVQVHIRARAIEETDDPAQRAFLQRLMDPSRHRITEFRDASELVRNTRATLERWISESFSQRRLAVPFERLARPAGGNFAPALLALTTLICAVIAAMALWPGSHFVGLII